jgi:tetratricopeptide (TPR) repeat protein
MSAARWGVACAASAALAAVVLAATARPDGVLPRAAGELTDVEIELLLTKLREGDLLAIRRDFGGARRAWEQVRARGRGLWMVHEGLGDSLRRAGLPAEALAEYGTAAELAPPGRPAQDLSAKRARTLEELERPLDAFRAWLDAYPVCDRARVMALVERLGPEEAVREARARAAIDPVAFALVADLERRSPERRMEALAEYFVRAAPWDAALAREVTGILQHAGRTDRAVEVCRAWATASPGALEPWRRMGDVLRAAGRVKEALAAYASMVDVRPGQADAHRALADALLAMGRRSEAAVQLEAARRARPEDRETWEALLACLDEAAGDRLAAEAAGKFPGDGAFRARWVEARRRELDRLSPAEAVARRRAWGVEGFHELALYDVKVTLTWDVDADVDLEMREPGGETVGHRQPASKAGGRYVVDDTRRRGPETYLLAAAPPGTYRAGVHLHGERQVRARADFVLFEGTSRERRWTEEAALGKGGEGLDFAPFEVR